MGALPPLASTGPGASPKCSQDARQQQSTLAMGGRSPTTPGSPIGKAAGQASRAGQGQAPPHRAHLRPTLGSSSPTTYSSKEPACSHWPRGKLVVAGGCRRVQGEGGGRRCIRPCRARSCRQVRGSRRPYSTASHLAPGVGGGPAAAGARRGRGGRQPGLPRCLPRSWRAWLLLSGFWGLRLLSGSKNGWMEGGCRVGRRRLRNSGHAGACGVASRRRPAPRAVPHSPDGSTRNAQQLR